MSEEVKSEDTITATETTAQQGDTTSDVVVEVADTAPTGVETKPTDQSEQDKGNAPESKKDLLGDVKQQDGKEQAPEKYEPFTLADGKVMDDADSEAIASIAREHNLSQESAQKAALVASALVDKMVNEHEEHKAKVLAENEASWKKQDPSGELTMLARKAVQKLGPEMENHLRENEYLADARIMSILADYGRLISEGKSISGKPAHTQSLLYPNTPQLYNNNP